MKNVPMRNGKLGLLQIKTVFVLRIILPFLQLGEYRWEMVVGPRVPEEGDD